MAMKQRQPPVQAGDLPRRGETLSVKKSSPAAAIAADWRYKMANGITELLDELYNMVSDAWGLPLGAEKCVIERNKALDLLDEIKEQLPTELAEAQRLVSARSEFIANAKKEADSMRKAAEEHARRMVDEQTIIKAAKMRSNEIINAAEKRGLALRKAANEYADDAMRRTESAISEALEEVRQSRVKFRSAASADAAGISVEE